MHQGISLCLSLFVSPSLRRSLARSLARSLSEVGTHSTSTLNIFWILIEWLAELNTSGDFIALAKRRACLVISACSSDEKVANTSYLVPTRMATALLLIPRACLHHSLIALSVSNLCVFECG